MSTQQLTIAVSKKAPHVSIYNTHTHTHPSVFLPNPSLSKPLSSAAVRPPGRPGLPLKKSWHRKTGSYPWWWLWCFRGDRCVHSEQDASVCREVFGRSVEFSAAQVLTAVRERIQWDYFSLCVCVRVCVFPLFFVRTSFSYSAEKNERILSFPLCSGVEFETHRIKPYFYHWLFSVSLSSRVLWSTQQLQKYSQSRLVRGRIPLRSRSWGHFFYWDSSQVKRSTGLMCVILKLFQLLDERLRRRALQSEDILVPSWAEADLAFDARGFYSQLANFPQCNTWKQQHQRHLLHPTTVPVLPPAVLSSTKHLLFSACN